MTSSPLTSFASDVSRLADDPHAIGERLRALLSEDDWLAPEHREPDPDAYRQHLLYVSPDRDVSIVALVWLPRPSTEEDIHDVTAVGDEPTISIHVYGADIEQLGTSIYRRFDDWPVRRLAPA